MCGVTRIQQGAHVCGPRDPSWAPKRWRPWTPRQHATGCCSAVRLRACSHGTGVWGAGTLPSRCAAHAPRTSTGSRQAHAPQPACPARCDAQRWSGGRCAVCVHSVDNSAAKQCVGGMLTTVPLVASLQRAPPDAVRLLKRFLQPLLCAWCVPLRCEGPCSACPPPRRDATPSKRASPLRRARRPHCRRAAPAASESMPSRGLAAPPPRLLAATASGAPVPSFARTGAAGARRRRVLRRRRRAA